MQTSRCVIRTCLSTALLAAMGCHSPYHHNPYGNGYGMPTYGAPQYAVPPGASFAPGGSFPAQSFPDQGLAAPTYIDPNTSGYPTGSVPTYGTPTPADDSSDSLDRWERADDGLGGGGPSDGQYFDEQDDLQRYDRGDSTFDRDVPDPRNLDDGRDMFPTDGLGMNINGGSQRQASAQPVVDRSHAVLHAESQPVFEEPVSTVSQSRDLSNIDERAFGHDPERYAWMAGIVDFDDEERVWHIFYSLKPTPGDQFGGNISIIPNDKLKAMRNGDIVRLTGFVSNSSQDSFGKPMYRVETVQIVTPTD